jgi:hypothetical protein
MRVCGGADANRLISPNPHAPKAQSHYASGNDSLGIKNISGDVPQRFYMAVLLAVVYMTVKLITRVDRLSKMMVSGQKVIIKMQPSIVLTYFTLFASLAGHAEAFSNDSGLCLAAAYGRDPNCDHANDVPIEVTVIQIEVDGGLTCIEGETFKIKSVTKDIKVHATNRYDFGVYIGLEGDSDAMDGKKCLVQSLTEADADQNPNVVVNSDGDSCYDYHHEGTSEKIIRRFTVRDITILCKAGPGTNTAIISACYVYQTKAHKENELDCDHTSCSTNDAQQQYCLLPDQTVSFSSRLLLEV